MRAILLALLLTSCATFAEPLAQVESNGVRIVLYTELCALPAIINLPFRAEWTGNGKTFAGCWGINTFSSVVMFFDDRTAASIPVQLFTKVQGA